MVVVVVVIVLGGLGWFLFLGPGSGRDRRSDGPDATPEAVPSDFGRWPGICDSAAEDREAELTRRLLAGTVDPQEYRRSMARLAREDSATTGRW